MALHPEISAVTDRVIERSRKSRAAYLRFIDEQSQQGLTRPKLSCGNFAHGFAAAEEDKAAIRENKSVNIGIVTAYNDMLSAHQPYARYPDQIKIFAREAGATAQVAGGTPAMCDGVTQGQLGMELSLFSRDVIALSTAVGLSHGMFDAMALLGICDKIVPGLLIGALRFGHLPGMLIPAGPMRSGIANKEKARVRQLYAEGKASRDELLEVEARSYHEPGTCTFYGTANSNQMMMEVMGLHFPGAAFINPGTPLRQALTRAGVHRLVEISTAKERRPLGLCVDEKAVVNAVIGLLATGGSTNHAIHIPAIARAAGIVIDWSDFDRLSGAVPLIAKVYPNGSADVNNFHDAGGMAFTIQTLLDAGLLHDDILTLSGEGLRAYAKEVRFENDALHYELAPEKPRDPTILRAVSDPFAPDGGMRVVEGKLGRGVFKTSAVDKKYWTIEAPCRVFDDQKSVTAAFKNGELDRDVVVVVRFQGAHANGMPELHQLTPSLGVVLDRGFKVALVTDGRMSGASGKVPAAIHVYPEASQGGPLSKLRDGDIVRLCAQRGELTIVIDDEDWAARTPAPPPKTKAGTGRELFAFMRHGVDDPERGASAMLAAFEEEVG